MSEAGSGEQPRRRRAPLPPSPCVGVCVVNEAHGFCQGCGRTPDDISGWQEASDADKNAIWRVLPGRLSKLGVKTFRLPATPEGVTDFVRQSLKEQAGRWSMGLEDALVSFEAGDECELVADDQSTLVARNTSGQTLRYCVSDRVRAFGLADPSGLDGMAGIALVLPRARAELTDDAAVTGSDAEAGHRLDVQYPFARFWQASGTGDLRAATVLGEVRGSATPGAVEKLLAYRFEPEAPGQYGIARAFAVCAVFQAGDRDWLASAIAP